MDSFIDVVLMIACIFFRLMVILVQWIININFEVTLYHVELHLKFLKHGKSLNQVKQIGIRPLTLN